MPERGLWLPEQHDQRCPARQGGACVKEDGCKVAIGSADAAVIAQREVYRAQALCIAYKAAADDQARVAVLHAIGEAVYTALEVLRG